jgi:tetratricopeptide (TPR) repeat protein
MIKKMVTKSEDEIQNKTRSYMERVLGGAVPTCGSEKQYQAQELYFEAMETGDINLIFQALEIDPGNTECHLKLLSVLDAPDTEKIEMVQQILKIAEKRLGKAMFKECKGDFWLIFETRPYMRARSTLAWWLLKTGRIAESIAEHEGMLELNPGDNQGIRYGLLGLYLQENRIKDAARLLKEFKDERSCSAVMAWGYVLERFLTGKLDVAAKALDVARKQNGYVEAYLKGHRKLPKESVGCYSHGSREEAQLCAELQKPAWDVHPEAIKWLENSK